MEQCRLCHSNSGSETSINNIVLETGVTISGTVTDGSGGIQGVIVQVFSDKCWQNQVAAATTDQEGAYSISVPAGSYYILAYAGNVSTAIYVSEWWNGVSESGTIDCNSAVLITAPVSALDFQLDPGGTISGTVFQSDGTTAVTGQEIHVDIFSGDPCGSNQYVMGTVINSANGTYSITGIPEGTYYLRTWNNGAPYLNEWWASLLSSVSCSGARTFTVSSGDTISALNFQLDPGVTISGTVTATTGGDPIANVCVTAFSSRCWTTDSVGEDRQTRTGFFPLLCPWVTITSLRMPRAKEHKTM